jgi:hypothetical protein
MIGAISLFKLAAQVFLPVQDPRDCSTVEPLNNQQETTVDRLRHRQATMDETLLQQTICQTTETLPEDTTNIL